MTSELQSPKNPANHEFELDLKTILEDVKLVRETTFYIIDAVIKLRERYVAVLDKDGQLLMQDEQPVLVLRGDTLWRQSQVDIPWRYLAGRIDKWTSSTLKSYCSTMSRFTARIRPDNYLKFLGISDFQKVDRSELTWQESMQLLDNHVKAKQRGFYEDVQESDAYRHPNQSALLNRVNALIEHKQVDPTPDTPVSSEGDGMPKHVYKHLGTFAGEHVAMMLETLHDWQEEVNNLLEGDNVLDLADVPENAKSVSITFDISWRE